MYHINMTLRVYDLIFVSGGGGGVEVTRSARSVKSDAAGITERDFCALTSAEHKHSLAKT